MQSRKVSLARGEITLRLFTVYLFAIDLQSEIYSWTDSQNEGKKTEMDEKTVSFHKRLSTVYFMFQTMVSMRRDERVSSPTVFRKKEERS